MSTATLLLIIATLITEHEKVCNALRESGCSAVEELKLEKAREFMQSINKNAFERVNWLSKLSWGYQSNITDENLKAYLEAAAEIQKIEKAEWEELRSFSWKNFTDPDLRRQFWLRSNLGVAALPEEQFQDYTKITAAMEKVYSTATICSFYNSSRCDLVLEPDLVNILQESRNPDELKHVWSEWRKAVGRDMKEAYAKRIGYVDKAAAINGFSDATEMWLHSYESSGIKEEFRALWEQLRPLYLQVHAYVRDKLRRQYGEIVSEKGPIPAHLLGNMWAQNWKGTLNFTQPYPGRERASITDELVKQGYTPLKIFKTAEDFFTSIDFPAMPPTFWENSIIAKPEDGRKLVCHASAWDLFGDPLDVRIKQCTEVTEDHFYTAHHEMGHIEYFILYSHLPATYRNGANEGFHEAIGDTIFLSVSTRKHLKKIGLVENASSDPKDVVNYLFSVALHGITFLPFGYLMDLWRWDVLSGKIMPEDYNCHWWKLRNEYQGVEPPVDRSEEDFDPAAKYHILIDYKYISYFVSTILQYQCHRVLCLIAEEYDPKDSRKPLYKCNIYGNKNAGNAFKKMLRLGSSRPWRDTLEVLTGQRNMDASGILEYFDPLMKWLTEENRKNGAFVGWGAPTKVCTKQPKSKAADKGCTGRRTCVGETRNTKGCNTIYIKNCGGNIKK